MPKSSAPENRPLVGPLAVIVIALVLVAVLVLLFPGRHYADVQRGSGVYDTASLAYLRTLMKIEPHNDALRLGYARQLLARGDLKEVQPLLSGLSNPHAPAAELLELRLRMAQFAALKPQDPGRAAAKQRVQQVMASLSALPADALTDAQIQSVAKSSLAFGFPAEAARWYETLAKRHPSDSYAWWALAGKWWLAAGNPARAGTAWQHALHAARTPERMRAAQTQTLTVARMTASPAALALVRKQLQRHPDDTTLLSQAINVALAAGNAQQALVWARHLAALKPGDDAVQRQLGQVALANGDLATALPIYEGLAQRHPQDAQVQHRLAELFLWTGHADKALPWYVEQARRHPSAANDRELLKLARAAYDYPVAAQALLRQNARQRLSPSAMTELVTALDDEMGEPQRTAQVLESWLGGAPADYPLWRRLAAIYARTDQPQQAMATWRRIIARYGRKPADVTALAALQVESWHLGAAMKTLTSLLAPGRSEPADPAYWENLGAVALSRDDMPTVARAYGWLFEHKNGDVPEANASRLVTAWLRLDNPDRATQVVQRLWRYHPDAALLLQVLGYALDHDRSDLANSLFALAQSDPRAFDTIARYWVLLGNKAFNRGQFDAARADYHKALSIAPADADARAAFLSLLLTEKDRDALRRYLALWYPDAEASPPLWEVYALGYSALGKPRIALSWFARRAAARPKDYLWLLSYADGLDAARRFDDAYRLRLYALTRLRPQLLKTAGGREATAQRQRDYRVVTAQQALIGNARDLAWLQRVLKTRRVDTLNATDLQLLVDWHLSANQPAYARYWLLRAQMRRMRLPDYQQLSVALAANDVSTVGAILARSTEPGVADRVAGWERTGHTGTALLLALNHINARQPWSSGIDSLPRYAAEAYQKMPQNAGTELVATRIGGLLMSTQLGSVKRSTTHWTAEAGARATQLTHRGIALILDGIGHEYAAWAKLTHRGDRSTTSVTLGRVDSAAGGFTQASFDFGYALTHRLHADLFAHYNEQTLDSAYFRALGTRDSAGADFDYLLNARDTLSLNAAGLRYQSRWNDYLGTGYTLGATFNRALKRGQTYEIDAYTDLSFTRNQLTHRLPYRMYARMPTGSDVNTVLPDEYGFAGVGFAIARGQPGTDYPTVSGLRYHADFGFGYIWPDNRIGLAFTAAVGHRVLGSDELSLFFSADQTQAETGGTALSVGLRYRYFLGK